MTDTRERAIIRAFVDITEGLVDHYDVVEMLDRLTVSCADLLDVDSAGLLLADDRGVLHLAASSSDQTHDLEVYQLQRDQGPCLDSYHRRRVVLVPDLNDAHDRWPAFTRHALEAGFASVHAVPMRLRDTVLGTLGLFGTQPGPLGDDDVALAQALAHVASVTIVNEHAAADRDTVNAQLQSALSSRVVLEQAKGVIAHAAGLDMGAAFEALRTYARHRGERLTDVAARVVDRDLDVTEVVSRA